MIQYYREENGDYLAVDLDTANYYREAWGKVGYEGRATAIEGLVTSMCTTGIGAEHLQLRCTEVDKSEVPAEWLEAIG